MIAAAAQRPLERARCYEQTAAPAPHGARRAVTPPQGMWPRCRPRGMIETSEESKRRASVATLRLLPRPESELTVTACGALWFLC